MKKTVTILGSTGSIGTQSIEVCKKLGYPIAALTANHHINEIERQARELIPRYVVITGKNEYETLKIRLADTSVKVLYGMEGLCYVAALEENDIVLNALVGMVGLQPTLAALEAKKDVALANKETLVAGGQLVMETARRNGSEVYPVDSEHSAIFQCLRGNNKKQVRKLLLTASGGPFFGYSKDQLKNITREQALCHPNWNMGEKITIDSSTLMNKGLELIEAMWLFGVSSSKIEILVHRQSIIHSMVEYDDNCIIAQLGAADMRSPIQYALTYPDRLDCPSQPLDFTSIAPLTFEKPDLETFTCLRDALAAAEAGGLATCILNGANEAAVGAFLNGEIAYCDIMAAVHSAMEHVYGGDYSTLDEVLKADEMAKEYVRSFFHK